MTSPSIFSWSVRVYWEDTDGGGIVYYANYLKFLERARTEWLRALGFEQSALMQTAETQAGLFVVSEINLRYVQSARLDDELWVTARVLESGRSSLTLAQQVLRKSSSQPALLCDGRVRLTWVDVNTRKPARIPSSILEHLTT